MAQAVPAPGAANGGSDRMVDSAEPRFLAIGRILRAHGVRGDLVVEVLTDYPERFYTLEVAYLGDAYAAEPRRVVAARPYKDRVLLRFEACDDRTSAERLSGLLVQIPIEEAHPLPEGEYYPHQLVGMEVVTTDGELLGYLSEVLFAPANDIYVVTRSKGELWLPAIADVVQQVDLVAKRMVVKLLDGLI